MKTQFHFTPNRRRGGLLPRPPRAEGYDTEEDESPDQDDEKDPEATESTESGCEVVVDDDTNEIILLLHGPITYENVAETIHQILIANLSGASRIHLVIMSSGGNLAAAFGLIDTIRGSVVPVYTYGLGEILSAGLMIFMAGHRRFVSKNASILSHQFSTGSGWSKFHELQALEHGLKVTQEQVIRYYQEVTGLSTRKIKSKLLSSSDTWLTPKEAVVLNLADVISEVFFIQSIRLDEATGNSADISVEDAVGSLNRILAGRNSKTSISINYPDDNTPEE